MIATSAFYGLPAEVKYCAKCVISNQRPISVVEFMNKPSDRKPQSQFDDLDYCSSADDSSLQHCDTIVQLGHGQIIEQGSYQHFISRSPYSIEAENVAR